MDKENKYSNLIWLLLIIAGALSHWPFLSGELIYYHDSLASLSTTHLFFNSILSGNMPLWSPELNAGQPLWLVVEAYQAFDPIAFIVWGISYYFSLNSIIAHQWTCFLWLFVYSWGAMKCVKYISRDKTIALIVFASLFLGPLKTEMIAQAPGFLLPFRYLPWVVLSFLNLYHLPSWKKSFTLSFFIGIGAANYQSIYTLVFLLIFISTYLIASLYCKQKSPKYFIKYFITSLFLASFWYLPTIISGLEMLRHISLTRLYGSSAYFSMGLQTLLRGLFDLSLVTSLWHGNSYLGIIPLIFIFIFLLSLLPFSSVKKYVLTPMEITFLTTALFCGFLCSEYVETVARQHSTLLGLRNWGFCLTPFTFSCCLLASAGFERLRINQLKISLNIKIISFILLFIFIYTELYIEDPVSRLFTYLISVPFLLTALFISVFHFYQNTKKFGYFLIFLTAIDLLRISNRPQDSIPLLTVKPTTIPIMNNNQSRFKINREWKYDINETIPFHYAGSAVHRVASATTDPLLPKGTAKLTGITGLFSLPTYEALIHSGVNEPVLKNIFGVTSPVIKLVNNVIESKNFEDSIKKLKEIKDSTWLNTGVILQGPLPPYTNLELLNKNESAGTWDVQSFSTNFTEIKLSLKSECFLVYSDNFTKDWQAFIDNTSTPVFIANGSFKAVHIPKGNHILQFRYTPILYILAFQYRALLLLAYFFYFLLSFNLQNYIIKKFHIYRLQTKGI